MLTPFVPSGKCSRPKLQPAVSLTLNDPHGTAICSVSGSIDQLAYELGSVPLGLWPWGTHEVTRSLPTELSLWLGHLSVHPFRPLCCPPEMWVT